MYLLHYQLILSLLISLLQLNGSESANILFFHLESSYSHRIAIWPLVEALASRGHNVTFIQPFPPKAPNPKVHEFYPEELGDLWATENEDGTVEASGDFGLLLSRIQKGPLAVQLDMYTYHPIVLLACTKFLSTPTTTKFIQDNSFDLVVIDSIFNNCGYGLAHKWGSKTILYSPTAPTGAWAIEINGFLGMDEPSWIPDQVVPFQTPMSFVERVLTTTSAIVAHLRTHWLYHPQLDSMLRTKLNMPEMPSVSELMRETSLVLYNSHFSEELARSLPPMFVSGIGKILTPRMKLKLTKN